MKKLLLMLFAVITISAVATLGATIASAETTSGITGDCTWTLDGTVLTISGEGKIGDGKEMYYNYPWGTSITEVIIEDGVTSIGSSVFAGCLSLTSITIPDSVTSIGWAAFSNCSLLTSVTIPDSVTSIGKFAFRGCSSLTSATIGNGVTSIGYNAFYGCSSLTSITIPDSVTSIDDNAFRGCSALTSVTIPVCVTSIGDNAFDECRNLKTVYIQNLVIAASLVNGNVHGNLASNADTICVEKNITYVSNFITSMPYKTEGVVVDGVTYTAYSNIPSESESDTSISTTTEPEATTAPDTTDAPASDNENGTILLVAILAAVGGAGIAVVTVLLLRRKK